MAQLSYVGIPQAASTDLVTKGYVSSLASGSLSQASVDSLINSGLSGYVSKTYVDTQDALNATPAFVDAGDAAKLHLSQIGVNNGIAGLDNTGKVSVARVPVTSTQRWPKPFISPSAYQASPVTTGSTEAQLFTVPVADPGFTYKLLVTGVFDAGAATDSQYPIVRVRQGSTTGQLVGVGQGLAETYLVGGVLTTYTTTGAHTYTVPGGFTNFDIVCLGGGGGANTFFADNGGGAGVFASASLISGSTLPSSTTTLTAKVGAGGANGAAGVASTVTGTGVTTISGAGGAVGASSDTSGLSPGTFTLHSQPYVGGTVALTGTGDGHPPGGGSPDSGTNGAPGAVWILAYNSLSGSASGPVSVLPQAFNLQTALTGATTLYVMLVSSGTGNVTASTLRPTLYVVPIPA